MFKRLSNYPDYFVSDNGQIYSTITHKIIKQYKTLDGHLQISLGHKNRHKLIHRIVLETFIGPCPEGMECCHKNGNPADNRLENLRWDTRSNNRKDDYLLGVRTGFNGCRGSYHSQSKLTEQDVRMIIYMWKTLLFTQREIADIYKISSPNINLITHKKIWKHLWKG